MDVPLDLNLSLANSMEQILIAPSPMEDLNEENAKTAKEMKFQESNPKISLCLPTNTYVRRGNQI